MNIVLRLLVKSILPLTNTPVTVRRFLPHPLSTCPVCLHRLLITVSILPLTTRVAVLEHGPSKSHLSRLAELQHETPPNPLSTLKHDISVHVWWADRLRLDNVLALAIFTKTLLVVWLFNRV